MKAILDQYVEAGKLSQRAVIKNGITYLNFCYTKMAFFAFDWDEILISHRGKIYREDAGYVAINNPIPKIFNIDEHPTSSFDNLQNLMKTERYEVLDKVNGHLVIVSPDASTQFKNILVSTKGSFEGLAEQDEELLYKMGVLRVVKRNSLNYTLMFECLAEYDKHLWYEEQKNRYGGEDTMVLLAAVDNNTGEELNYEQLVQMGFVLGCPVTKRYEHLNGTDVNKWFEHKGIEGYVVHFPNSKSRIKVKTKEYTTLRYLKEITTEKLVNALYNSQMFNLYLDYDEEIYPILEALERDMHQFLEDEMCKCEMFPADTIEQKIIISKNKDLNGVQKAYLLGTRTNEFVEKMFDRKKFREAFKERGTYEETQAAITKMFGEKAALLSGLECV